MSFAGTAIAGLAIPGQVTTSDLPVVTSTTRVSFVKFATRTDLPSAATTGLQPTWRKASVSASKSWIYTVGTAPHSAVPSAKDVTCSSGIADLGASLMYA